MLDDVGAGAFFANATITIGMLFLLIMNIVLIYLKERKAKWILISIALNIFSSIYFGGYAANSIVFFNLFCWPLANFIFITWLYVKNIVLYRKDKERYKNEHQQSKARRIIIKIFLVVLIVWLIVVVWFFFRAMFGFFNIL